MMSVAKSYRTHAALWLYVLQSILALRLLLLCQSTSYTVFEGLSEKTLPNSRIIIKICLKPEWKIENNWNTELCFILYLVVEMMFN